MAADHLIFTLPEGPMRPALTRLVQSDDGVTSVRIEPNGAVYLLSGFEKEGWVMAELAGGWANLEDAKRAGYESKIL